MKTLAYISAALGTIAIITAIFAATVTYPQYKSARRAALFQTIRNRNSLFNDAETRARNLEDQLKGELIGGMWGAGGLALIFGILAARKKYKLGYQGIGCGAVAILVSVAVQPAHW